MFLLSSHRVRQLYCIESLHVLAQLRSIWNDKERHCGITMGLVPVLKFVLV